MLDIQKAFDTVDHAKKNNLYSDCDALISQIRTFIKGGNELFLVVLNNSVIPMELTAFGYNFHPLMYNA